MISPALELHYELQRDSAEAMSNMFRGMSIRDYAMEIGALIKHSNIHSILDYGCGQATGHQKHRFKNIWKINKLTLFDPAYEQFSARPTEPHDLVLCIDVMEHVPINLVDEVLEDINKFADKAAFFTISTRPATKKTVDGNNAHATVMPKEWWLEKLQAVKCYTVVHFTDE